MLWHGFLGELRTHKPFPRRAQRSIGEAADVRPDIDHNVVGVESRRQVIFIFVDDKLEDLRICCSGSGIERFDPFRNEFA